MSLLDECDKQMSIGAQASHRLATNHLHRSSVVMKMQQRIFLALTATVQRGFLMVQIIHLIVQEQHYGSLNY